MTVELPIVGVTVHPDGAIVRRRGRCDIQDGRVRVHRLPLLLEPGTVRAAVREGTLRDVRLDFDLPFDDRGDAVAEQVAVVENLAAQARVDAEIAHVDAMRALARGLTPGFDPEGPAPTAASLEGWAALDAALDPWLEALDARARELQREREELGRRAQSLRWALQSRSDESLWRRWMPTRRLDLAVEAAGSVEVEVSYAIVGARWSPAYAVDFDRDLSRGRLTMRALVGQATGEDWSDVEVAFASVPCRRVVDLPELASMKLGTAAPAKPTGWRPLPDDLDGLFPSDPVSVLATENERSRMDQESGAFLDDEKPDVSSRRGPPVPSPDAMPMPSPAPMPAGAPMPSMPPAAVYRSEAPAAKSASMVGGLFSAGANVLGDAFDAMGGFAGSAEEAPAMERVQQSRKRSSRAAPPRGPRRLGVGDDQLDYASLRLAGSEAGKGVRGRLRAEDEEARLREATGSRTAWERWSAQLRSLVAGTHALEERSLPPHHVVPGPVGGRDVLLRAPGRATVPSDGRFHAVSVFTGEARARIEYMAVPRMEKKVFRTVVATLEREGALLPGPMEATIEGALVLVAPFAGSAGDSELRFGLGAEDGLQIARNVRYHEESAGLLGGSRRFSTHIDVEIASALDRPVVVDVYERVPVPLTDALTFDVVEARPVAHTWKGERDGPVLKGGRRQRVEVAAGAKASATLGYAVTLSNREELNGGDRRG